VFLDALRHGARVNLYNFANGYSRNLPEGRRLHAMARFVLVRQTVTSERPSEEYGSLGWMLEFLEVEGSRPTRWSV